MGKKECPFCEHKIPMNKCPAGLFEWHLNDHKNCECRLNCVDSNLKLICSCHCHKKSKEKDLVDWEKFIDNEDNWVTHYDADQVSYLDYEKTDNFIRNLLSSNIERVKKAIKERSDIIPEIYYLRMVEIINNIK